MGCLVFIVLTAILWPFFGPWALLVILVLGFLSRD